MKSTARLIVSALLTLALSVIGTAGYAAAGNGQREHLGSSASHHHGRLEQDGSTRVLRALGRLDRKLVHATRASRLAPLTDADRDALQINAEADVAAVGAVADSYSATPDADSLAAARQVLRTFRAVRYLHAENLLRRAERLAGQIATLQGQVTPGGDDAAALDEAGALLAGVPASGFSASSTRADMHHARLTVSQAQGLVDLVQSHLA